MTEARQPQPSKRRIAPVVRTLAPWAVTAAMAAAWWSARPKKHQPGLSEDVVAEPEHFEQREPGRGRLAPAPHRIPWIGWKDVLWRTYREVSHDRLTVVAGSVTFYTLLAIFPALGVFVSLYGLIADVRVVEAQLAQLALVFPSQVVTIMGDQMIRLATERGANLSLAFVISLLLSLWTANAGMKALFDGLNIAYDEVEKRNFFLRTALTYAFTFAFLLFVTVVTAILVAAPLALRALGVETGWLVGVRWVVLFVVATGAFSIAYRYGPCRTRARWRWVTWGAVAAAATWLLGSAAYSWYLNNVAHLQATYGSLGAVIGFMLWVWVSVMIVLMGAELNAEIEHQTALDSTVGPPKPMGRRGAAMADTVGLPFIGVRKGVRKLAGMGRRQVGALLGLEPKPPEPAAKPANPSRRRRRPKPTLPPGPPGARPGPRR